MKYYIDGYGSYEFKPWEELKNREVRYICTDYEADEQGIDLYEVEDEQADDFGECYTTRINTPNAHCDDYGVCGGSSCFNYARCQGWVN